MGKSPYISALGQKWCSWRKSLIWVVEVANLPLSTEWRFVFTTEPAQAPHEVVYREVSDSESDTHICICRDENKEIYTAMTHQGTWYKQDTAMSLVVGLEIHYENSKFH
jgi:hypothetical protein